MTEKPMQKYPVVFSGDNGIDMWEAIDAVDNNTAQKATHSIGRQCQKLETIVIRLERRISQLEKWKLS